MDNNGAPLSLDQINCQIKEPVLEKLKNYSKDIWTNTEEDHTAIRNFKKLEN